MAESIDRDLSSPFLIRLFYRTGAFYRPEEFTSHHLPPHVSIYAWPDCTLNELALDLAVSEPSALPFPAIGTRLVFQLVCPDLRSTSAVSNAQPRFAVKHLGSVVIGQGGPGVDGIGTDDIADPRGVTKDGEKTLTDARFVVGDYVSCAVLPPLPDGSVASPSSARQDPVESLRDSLGGRGGHRGGFTGRGDSFGRGGDRGGPSWRRGGGQGFPQGEWRRGERLPDEPSRRSRGRARW